jgi:hypothetical protein
MAILISGPGIGLPPPQNLYPSELNNAPYDAPTNYLALVAGQFINIPAGRWFVDPGAVSVIQYLDPVTGIWRTQTGSAMRGQAQQVLSDGFTRRIANLTGCPIGAIVTSGGSSWVQSSTTVTSNLNGSTWQAVVGGSLSVSSVTAAGAKYSIAPEVFIPAPPYPGVQATAYATIASGTVSGVTLTNFGAGYISAPVPVLLPNPLDPNVGSITQASVTLVLTAANASVITAVLPLTFGTPLPSASIGSLTLTAAGGSGTGATITPVIMQSIVSASVVAGGGGWGVAAVPALVTTAGGVPTSTSAIVNPGVELTGFRPRQGIINVTTSAAGAISAPVVTDPGLFAGTPTPVIIPGGTLPTTLASVALTMGAVNDFVLLQPV